MNNSNIYWESSYRFVGEETQKQIDKWFLHYNVSFNDPTRFATILYSFSAKLRAIKDAEKIDELSRKCGARQLHEILVEVAGLRSHRHRLDAMNIIEEVNRRMKGYDPRPIKPMPLNPAPRPQPGGNIPLQPLTADEVASLVPGEYGPNDPLPDPWIRQRDNKLPAPTRGLRNMEIQQVLVTQATNDLHARAGIVGLVSLGSLNLGRTRTAYLDNPTEIFRDMPHQDKVPMIWAPIRPSTDGKTPEQLLDDNYQISDDETYWATLDILDLRRGTEKTCGYLEESDYIYQLIAIARRVLSQPEVARNYVWICRAYPSRYQNDTDDKLEDENPPTAEEVACIMSLIRMTFPEVVISPTKNTLQDPTDMPMDESMDEGRYRKSLPQATPGYSIRARSGVDPALREEVLGSAYGVHSRVSDPTAVVINGKLFDLIEYMYYQRQPIGHIFYLIFVVISHELAHYLNTCIWIREQGRLNNIDFSQPTSRDNQLFTPRAMRWLIENATAEFSNSPDYDILAFRVGEMGGIIEWSLYNYLLDFPMSMEDFSSNESLLVACWGSYSYILAQFPDVQQLRFSAFAGTQLFRSLPPIRMPSYDAIEAFNNQMAAAEMHFKEDLQLSYSMQGLLGTSQEFIDVVDVNAQYTGYDLGQGLQNRRYRRAVQSINRQQYEATNFSIPAEPKLFKPRIPNVVYGEAPPLIPPGWKTAERITPIFLVGFPLWVSIFTLVFYDQSNPRLWNILNCIVWAVYVLFFAVCVLPARTYFRTMLDRRIYTAAATTFLFLTFGGPSLVVWATSQFEVWEWLKDYEGVIEFARLATLIMCTSFSALVANLILNIAARRMKVKSKNVVEPPGGVEPLGKVESPGGVGSAGGGR